MNEQLQLDPNALDFIKKAEGLREQWKVADSGEQWVRAYQCPAGVWTIGYGSTGPKVTESLMIAASQADRWLREELVRVEALLKTLVKVRLNQNQYTALASFVHHIGPDAFTSSHVLQELNQENYAGCAEAILKWNRCGGQVNSLLEHRRQAEVKLFRTWDGMEFPEADKTNLEGMGAVPRRVEEGMEPGEVPVVRQAALRRVAELLLNQAQEHEVDRLLDGAIRSRVGLPPRQPEGRVYRGLFMIERGTLTAQRFKALTRLRDLLRHEKLKQATNEKETEPETGDEGSMDEAIDRWLRKLMGAAPRGSGAVPYAGVVPRSESGAPYGQVLAPYFGATAQISSNSAACAMAAKALGAKVANLAAYEAIVRRFGEGESQEVQTLVLESLGIISYHSRMLNLKDLDLALGKRIPIILTLRPGQSELVQGISVVVTGKDQGGYVLQDPGPGDTGTDWSGQGVRCGLKQIREVWLGKGLRGAGRVFLKR